MDEQTRAERAYSELLQRLPASPVPLGFREKVMARIGHERPQSWEWIAAAVVGIPNLVFLAWELLVGNGELAFAVDNLAALFTSEDWSSDASFAVDGMVLLALALVGLAAMLMTHALVISRRASTMLRSV
jgi:hypothetical protein